MPPSSPLRPDPEAATQSDPLLDFDLAAFLPYRLAAAAARISRSFAERYREEFGISIPEWRVLAHLNHAGPVSVRDIEARADMEKSKVSRAVSRLEAAGYVSKAVNDDDKRLLVVQLTDAGRALLRRLLPVAMQFQAEMLSRLGPAAEGLDAGLALLLAGDGITHDTGAPHRGNAKQGF